MMKTTIPSSSQKMTYFNVQEQEERDFHVSSDSEWDRAEACEAGAAEPDRAWILTDRDVWHANPYYTGPAVPHPEDDYDGYDDTKVCDAAE